MSYKKIIKILYFIIICIFITSIIISCGHSRECRRQKISSYRKNVITMILNEPNVLDAKILYDENENIKKDNREFAINILLNNNGSLRILGVNEEGKGDMVIDSVGIYDVRISNRSISYTSNFEQMQVWSVIIGEQIETVLDIIRNYDVISLYINENLPENGKNYHFVPIFEIDENNYYLYISVDLYFRFVNN